MNPSILPGLLQDNPIAITGMGCFCAAGDSIHALWNAALAGCSLASWREFAGTGGRHSRFAVCPGGAIDCSVAELRPVRKADRCVQMALLAARGAWEQARIEAVYRPERIGVMVGSSRGPVQKIQESFSGPGSGAPLPSLSAQTSIGSLSGLLAQVFTLKGPGGAISTTCASAAFAIAFAAEQILLGKADAMLVGGAEAPLHEVVLAQLHAAGVLGSHDDAQQVCRPFDVSRNGMVTGEGSAFLVLEPARLARQRGIPALAHLTGWAVGIDDSGRTGVHSDGSGLLRVMDEALGVARLSPNQIDYINTHGTGTTMSDSAEAQAVSRLFQNHSVPCSSTKPITGHCLGATPALEAILCIEALRNQILPSTVNCVQLDPLCPINVLTGEPRSARATSAMSNSLGFWGYHASLIFSRA